MPTSSVTFAAFAPTRFAVGIGAFVLAPLYFLGANLLRFLLLGGTGLQALQLDYALVPLFFWLAHRVKLSMRYRLPVGFLVAAAVTAGDILDVMSARFHWSRGVVVDYAYSMPDLPWPAILPFIALVLVVAIISVPPFLGRGWRDFRLWPLAALIVALGLADAALHAQGRGDVRMGRLLQSFSMDAAGGAYRRIAVGRSLTPITGPSLAGELTGTVPRQILVVGFESLGAPRSPGQREALLGPLLAATRGTYAASISARRFEGSTLAGELRELCSLRPEGIPSTAPLLAELGGCLPARLKRQGYDTQAFHGNGPLMYDRLSIYPAMGFRRSWFDADLRAADRTLQPCPGTAFEGVCDADVYARALSQFDGGKRFVHVLTLDAHLPLPGESGAKCLPGFQASAGLCRYGQVVRASLAALGRAIDAARSPPDLIVIYGDHAPPFGLKEARKSFLGEHVPYIVLKRAVGRTAA